MTRKQDNLTEGPLDFMRGAGAEVGRKVANTGIVRAGRDILQAGKAASQVGDIRTQVEKSVAQLAHLLAYIDKVAPGMLSPNPGAKQQMQQPVQQQQAQAPQPKAGVNPSGDPFKANHKPKMREIPGYGAAYQFNTFMQALHSGQEELHEGLWDFVQGAGKAAGTKVRDAVNSYGSKPSVLKDIYSAGQRASAAGDEKAAADKDAATKQKAERVKMQMVELVRNILQTASTAGDQAPQLLMQAVRRAGGNMAPRITKILSNNAHKFNVKI